MDKIGDVLRRFDPKSGKYISREFQAFGLYIAKRLDDEKHKTLYIRFAKTMPRFLLDEALTFTMEANAKNKGALFMWKFKELRKAFKERQEIKVKSQNSKVKSASQK